MIKNLDEILEKLEDEKKAILSVAAAHDKEVLISVKDAVKREIITPILVGNVEKIKDISKGIGFNLEGIRIINSDDLEECAAIAVKLVSKEEADFVMKGALDTSTLLKSVLSKDYGLRTESLLSHVMIYQMDRYHKLLLITDGGMNISPNYDEKEKIVKNAVQAVKSLGIDTVKVACLCANEKVNPKMQSTIDADLLKSASKKGVFGESVIVEGPLAFDLAVSKEACDIKEFKSEIAGDADIIAVPTIEVGNGIGKSLTYMANAKSAGVIMGAKAPVVLTSRADNHESKLYSIAYGALISKNLKSMQRM